MADPKLAGTPAGARKTLIEEGTEFKGALTSTCAVVVSGKVDGEVEAPSLTVSATGAVYGKVKVSEIRSEGEIAGEIDADTVTLSGRVSNNTIIRSKSLEVKLASENGKLQVSFGDCMLEVGEEPKKAPRVPTGTTGALASPPKGNAPKAHVPAPHTPAPPAAPPRQGEHPHE
jgi:cytoskeletal protein CcmA (bactofilin family)